MPSRSQLFSQLIFSASALLNYFRALFSFCLCFSRLFLLTHSPVSHCSQSPSFASIFTHLPLLWRSTCPPAPLHSLHSLFLRGGKYWSTNTLLLYLSTFFWYQYFTPLLIFLATFYFLLLTFLNTNTCTFYNRLSVSPRQI